MSTKKIDIPIGIKLLQKAFRNTVITNGKNVWSRISVLALTFIIYVCYHATRKPLSVVKNVLNQNCTGLTPPQGVNVSDTSWCSWVPFDGKDANSLLGTLDSAFLFAYAFAMFGSGFVAERLNLRYYLCAGMFLSGISCALLGYAKIYNIHTIWYFIGVQIFGGIMQTSGWPSVVAIMGNWFGEGRNGLLFCIWNSHTSVGNIMGTLLASYFVEKDWSLSFIVPGVIMSVISILVFGFLMTEPMSSRHSRQKSNRTPQPERGVQYGTNTQIPTTSSSNEVRGLLQTENAIKTTTHEQEVEGRPILTQNNIANASNEHAVGFLEALAVPGVVEFALCLFFAKLVSYTFLYWLPLYINSSSTFGPSLSASISTLFDVGGIIGGIVAGALSDISRMNAFTCCIMLILSIPMLYLYYLFGSSNFVLCIVLLMTTGALVNGPYALITTAVSAQLSLTGGNKRSLATISSIIDGTGSIGAAVGPLLAGIVSTYFDWQYVFYMLMASDVLAFLMLSRLAASDCSSFTRFRVRGWQS